MNRILLIGKIIVKEDVGCIEVEERTKTGKQSFMCSTTNEKLAKYIDDYWSVGDDIALIGSLLDGYIAIKEVMRY